ncbi:MAG: methyltetrahydrofolate cobalamin methyltransferase [Deltaproteobacteria bacterium]|nr:methyltetrahydrofolate cobalamin methyltransferase [Deltaproteobacteria bacterium]
MQIVGELINASRKAVGLAIKEQDAKAIRDLAKSQYENGANYIDVNAGVFVENEIDYLKWLVENVQEEVDAPCCIDSPNPAAIEKALSIHKGEAMINSISLEKDRFDKLIPLVAGTDLKIIALCMSDEGMPETADDRFIIAEKLVNELVRNNVPLENIYVDPLVQPVSTNIHFGMACLDAIEKIMKTLRGCHTICGLSNISFGLPVRKLLNRTFISMAIVKGLDAVIINPLDTSMTSAVTAGLALAGQDDFCMEYIKAYRADRLS